MLLLTPFVKPFRWSRLPLTYAVPLIPMLVLFDGTASLLRIYLKDDLQELITTVPDYGSFEWHVGTDRIAGRAIGITHLVGVPKR